MLHDCGVAGPASVRDRLHQRPEAVRRADLVHGDDDQVVPVDAAGRASAKLVQDARLIVCEGGPHGITDTHKDRLNADLLAFVQG